MFFRVFNNFWTLYFTYLLTTSGTARELENMLGSGQSAAIQLFVAHVSNIAPNKKTPNIYL